MGLLKRFKVGGRGQSGETDRDAAELEREAMHLIDEGNVVEDEGRRKEALEKYEAAIRLAPNLARAYLNRGNVLQAAGDFEGALESFTTAIAKDSEYAAAHYNLGMAYLRLGRRGEARAALEAALSLKPDLVDAEVGLGCALEELGQLGAAAQSYRRALAINPGYAEVHANLGNVLSLLGQSDAALASYRRAVEINPDFANGHFGVGKALEDLGRPGEAVASYRRAIEINPGLATCHFSLGTALLAQGRVKDAVASLRHALRIDPDYSHAWLNLGNGLRMLGQMGDAATSFRRAVEINPGYAEAHCSLGASLVHLNQFAAAEVSFRRALELQPDSADAYSNLGAMLQDVGRLEEAEASYRRALEIKPEMALAYCNSLFCASHRDGMSPETLFDAHLGFGERFEAPLRGAWPQHANSREPERTLRVGFVSADFRSHAVASFIEPLLAHLRGSASLSLHAYYNHPSEDAVTTRLRGHFKKWHSVAHLSEDALAEKITSDGIDILIDLSGHTAGNRLLTFARKPAPVQVSWIGYPGTTGLSAVDYYLADRHFLPPGKFDSQFTEKLVYLPASAPFLPDKGAPAVNSLPATINGHLTFGSFNRITKLRPSVIELWSRLLRALPTARMLLGGMPRDDSGANALIDWFASEGIARERLSLHPRDSLVPYLNLHRQVDICLDTFPYTGGTTTNHALWMGVPTLTLAGQTAPGRQGAANLEYVGLDGFVAEDAADFQVKGLYWAEHLTELAEIRAGLRGRWEQSPVRKPEVIAAGVAQALRIMWQRWCAGLPPETFEVNAKR